MSGRRRKGGFGGFVVFIFIIIMIAMFSSLFNMAREEEEAKRKEQEQQEIAAFHDRFREVLDAYYEDGSLVTGRKAITLLMEERHEEDAYYTTDHVPEGYVTEQPEPVRYVIRYTTGRNMVGTYTGGGIAYKLWVEVEILDLKTGESMGSKTFFGGEPPQVVRSDSGPSHHGGEPEQEEIDAWLLNTLEGRTQQTEAIQPDSPPQEEQAKSAATEQENAAALELAQSLLNGYTFYSRSGMIQALEAEGYPHDAAVFAADSCGVSWMEQALLRVLSSVDYGGVSRSGLEEDLAEEGFTPEEIGFALDNCGADWFEQALIEAKDYPARYHLSYKGTIQHLRDWGFTQEQALYGADNCGLDWNEQAALRAKDYMEVGINTREGMVDQLIHGDEFTREQAEYGAAHCGLS